MSTAIPIGAARLRQALRLYVLTDRGLARGRGDLEIAAAAIAGGAGCIQLRCKDGDARDLYGLAEALAALCRARRALCIVNDRLDVALAAGVDGVHLGTDDLPIAAARRVAGPGLIIGASAATPAEARAAALAGADYLGAGAVFATVTKADAGAAIGTAGLAAVCAAVSLPVVAIGGICPENAGAALAAGAAGVAVISAVVGCTDVTGAAARLVQALDAQQGGARR